MLPHEDPTGRFGRSLKGLRGASPAARLEQFGCWNAERRRYFLNNEDGRIADAALDPADVGPVQPAFEGQGLLGPAALLAQPPHVRAHLPPDVHDSSGQGCRVSVDRL
jgi:hypothetical protein